MKTTTLRRSARGVLLGAAAVLAATWPVAAQERIQLPAADRPLALRPTSLFSIGVEDGEEWESFGNVTALAFDAHDNLYVLDSGNTRVFVFDRDGRHVRSFGRRGQGPGELTMPIGLTLLRNGEIVVGDVMRGALQRFAPDGTPVASLEMGGVRPTGRIEAHPRGGIVALASSMPTRIEGGPPPPRTRELRWWVGERGDSRAIFTAPPQQTNAAGTETIRVMMPPAFSPDLLWSLLPNGDVAVNAVEEYRIEIIDGGGTVRRVVERPIAPRRVTEKDKDAYRARQAESRVVVSAAGNAGVDSRAMSQLQASLANVEFNDRIPVLRRLAADPFGRLWVMRYAEVGDTVGPIDLIDADGGYMGTLPSQPLPSAFSRSGRIAYIERDELGVQRVVVKQVPLAPS